MELQKIGVKVFATAPNEIPLTDFIDIFHSWIQASDGVYHDVADYSHMQAGPGIVLVANDANVSIDDTSDRRGLYTTTKRILTAQTERRSTRCFAQPSRTAGVWSKSHRCRAS